jgi:hypothetical protein
MRCTALALCLGLLLASAGSARAQTIDDYYLDFAIPDLPGVGILGLSPSKIARPGPIKELAVSLLSLADDAHTITPGVALAWAPKQTFPGRSLDEYRRGQLRKVVLSFATVKNSRRTLLGVGGRFIVFDRSRAVDDRAFIEAVEGALDQVAMDDVQAVLLRNRLRNDVEPFVVEVARLVKPAVGPGDAEVERLRDVWTLPAQPPAPGALSAELKSAQFRRVFAAVARAQGRSNAALPAELESELERRAADFVVLAFQLADDRPGVIRTIRERVEKQKWNAASLFVDAGLSWAAPDSTWESLRGHSVGMMAAGSFPIGASGQGIVQVQYRSGLDPEEPERSSGSIGGRLLIGNSRNRLSLEGIVDRVDDKGARANSWRGRLTAGTELRIADGFWLEVAAGSEFHGPEGKSAVVSLANLKYTFRTKPRFVIPSSR